jgi:hypothetical protein
MNKMFKKFIHRIDEDRYHEQFQWQQGANMACALDISARKRVTVETQRHHRKYVEGCNESP